MGIILEFTPTLHHQFHTRRSVPNRYCTLKYVLPEMKDFQLDWKYVNDIGEPYEKVFSNRNFSSQIEYRRFKSFCKTIIFFSGDFDLLTNLRQYGNMKQDHFVFVFIVKVKQQKIVKEVVTKMNLLTTVNYKSFAIVEKNSTFLIEPSTYTDSVIEVSPHLATKKLNILNGRTINLTFPLIEPYSNPRKIKGSLAYLGSHYNLLMEVAKISNFTPNIIHNEDLRPGTLLKNGSWNGAMGLITNGQAEIAAVLALSFKRSIAVDFTTPTAREDLVFCLAEPKLLVHWKALVYPLSRTVWGITLINFLIISCLIYIYFKHGNSNSKGACSNVLNAVLLPITIFLGQPIPNKACRAGSLRILIANLWFSLSIVIGTTYKSNLVGFLTFPAKQSFPSTLKELYSRTDYAIYLHSIGGIEREILKTSPNPVIKALLERMVIVRSMEYCLNAATKPKTACIGWTNVLKIEMSKYKYRSSNQDNISTLYIAKDPAAFAYACVAFKKDSIFLESFNKYAGRIRAAGIIGKWNEDYDRIYHNSEIPDRKHSENCNHEHECNKVLQKRNVKPYGKSKVNPLTLRNILVVSLILIFGYSLSVVSIVVEILILSEEIVKRPKLKCLPRTLKLP
ncbi:unnamed protein product [Orchesella dallaii]|uniref:Uncharacterized protein n=1 Tax=Orchesella dallaii TaxID=48710 RepID=A0ABP1PL18_9HEXA